MTNSRLTVAEEIFSHAIDLSVGDRDSYVRKKCGDDIALLDEVNLLLEHHQQNETGDFILDRPQLENLLDATAAASIGEKVGDTICQYRLLERIGEGGMGVVYMAEQMTGVRRKVALKIIKLGMDTRQVVARFEAERQALALFDHPNIAKVLDAGATESGRPFFVMELIRGTSIKDHVVKSQLTLRDRLELFVKVCSAVHHAHQKGIIHRDLKPSNILVTLLDGVPTPKVIDFGIAKAMGQRLTEKTVFTKFSAMVGTPHYMSPEQAELNGTDIDTRADIYSLGVILYEILTGTTPIEKNKLSKLNLVSLFETLRDAEIETPSTRIEKAESNQNLGEVTRVISRHVKNELDWVVMKALAQNRQDRYASANELAADINRFLDGDPVTAAPPARFYKARALFRKHKNAAIFGIAVSVLLLVSTIVSSFLAVQGYRLNLKLKDALVQKSNNLSRAEAAEAELRKTLETDRYDSAHALTFSKFGQHFYNDLAEQYEKLYEDPQKVGELLGIDVETMNDELITFCIHFDWNWLIEFKSVDPKQLPVERLANSINKMVSQEKELDSYFFESVVVDDADMLERHHESPDEHSPLCKKLQEKTRQNMHLHRPKFFRTLVKEYRREFGNRDSRVRDALILLAVSLMDNSDFDEAEARTREAMALNQTGNVSLENRLLRTIKQLRKN